MLSIAIDVAGILGIPGVSIVALVKDSGYLLVKMMSFKKIERDDVLTLVHDIMGFIPIYS